MFGFGATPQKDAGYRVVPVLGATEPVKTGQLPEGVQLVAKEDIYASTAGRAVLLIRAGNTVSEEMLPKLIRHGATPHQFVLRQSTQGNPAKFDQQGAGKHTGGTHNPMREISLSRETVSIVIAESDAASLKRLLNGLATQGIYGNEVHTVRTQEQLLWALAHKQPSMLIIDSSFYPASGMMPVLREIRTQFGLQRIVLTVSKEPSPSIEALVEAAEACGIDVVFKPVNLFALSDFLKPYQARQVWGRAQQQLSRGAR